jgi:uncharacterized membrane protein
MKYFLEPQKSLLRDQRGTVTLLTSMSMVTLLCFLGLVIDVGDIYDGHRRLQGTNDLAAVAAASNLLEASTAADASVADNGYDTSSISSVVTGIYTGDPTIPVNQRFVPSAPAVANAALVTMSKPQPLFFADIFSLAGNGGTPTPNTAAVGSQSIAVNNIAASFTIGSALATLNGGVVNNVLGGLLGSNVSLSVMDYSNLVSTQIDLFQFAQALATEVGVTGVTYKQLFSGSVTLGQFVEALEAAGAGTAAQTALTEIAASAGGSSQSVNLSQLVNYGTFQNYQVGSPEVMAATVSASQLLTLAAGLADGGHQISLALGTTIPGIASVSGTMTVGEPPVGTTLVTIGSTGASVHTAQTRLMLRIGLLNTLGGNAVTLPLYLELASGTASLSSIGCNPLNAQSSNVTLAVTPAVTSAWIGQVNPALMTNFSTEPTVTPANLVNLGLITVNGYANPQVTNTQATNVSFSYSQITSDTMQATSTQDYFATLFTGLLGNLQLNATLAGVTVPVPTLAANDLGTVLASASTPVDQLVSEILQTLGVNIGVADIWVTGVNCAPAVVAQ